MKPLAGVTLPVLEIKTSVADFDYVDDYARAIKDMGLPTASTDIAALPISFRAL